MFDFSKLVNIAVDPIDTIDLDEILDDSLSSQLEDYASSLYDYMSISQTIDQTLSSIESYLFMYPYVILHGVSRQSYELLQHFVSDQVSISTEQLTTFPMFNETYTIACEDIKKKLLNVVEGADTLIHRGAVKLTSLLSNTVNVFSSYYTKLGKIDALLKNTRINEKYYHKLLLKKIYKYTDYDALLDNISNIVNHHADELLGSQKLIKSFESTDDIEELTPKIDENIEQMKQTINHMRELGSKPIRDELAKVAGYNLENVTELCEKVRTFVRECNETFRKQVKHLKSDRTIDKYVQQKMKKMEERFKWNKKKEGFDSSEKEFKKFQTFMSHVKLYLRYQSGFASQMFNESVRLTKIYINIATRFLEWGRQNKEQMEARTERKAQQADMYEERNEQEYTAPRRARPEKASTTKW
jgi:hypothetical protein